MLVDVDSVGLNREVRVLADALDNLIVEAGGCEQLIEPRGYPHLGLAVIDALFSLQAQYDSVVVPALKRYCDAHPTLTWAGRFDASRGEHGAQALVEFLGPMTTDERCEILTRNVAPGTTTRKADVCVEVAQVLLGCEIDSHVSFAMAVEANPGLEWKVRQVRGVGEAAWRYVLNLSRVEKSKPDTMVVRWVGRVLGATLSARRTGELVDAATAELQRRNTMVTVRTVDHLVWRKESGRPLSRAPFAG